MQTSRRVKPYRPPYWLENPRTRDKWVEETSARSSAKLESLPLFSRIEERLAEVFETKQIDELDREHLFQDKARDLADKLLESRGAQAAWILPEPQGDHIAVCSVEFGSDLGRLEMLDLASGELESTGYSIEPTQSASWSQEGLFYFGNATEEGLVSWEPDHHISRKLSSHPLGVYNEVASLKGHVVYTTPDSEYGLEQLRSISPDMADRELDLPPGQISFTKAEDSLYILSQGPKDNGRVLNFSPERPGELKELVPPHPERVIQSILPFKNGVAVSYLERGLPTVILHDERGEEICAHRFESPGCVSDLRRREDGNLELTWSSLIEPPKRLGLHAQTGALTELAAGSSISGFDPADYTTQQVWYESHDQTMIPMTLAYRKGITLDGDNPTHMEVYGGFGQVNQASFRSEIVPFLEAGGVFALPHIRGGGEMGGEWHEKATKENRPTAYRDLLAASQFLVEKNWTSSKHLSVGGSSSGGLAAGVAATKFSEQVAAAVLDMALLDMENFENLGGECWNQEYGSVNNANERQTLLDWSPLHQIHPGKRYPAVLITTGKADERVNPIHSYRFAEALQSAQPQGEVLLRADPQRGHGPPPSLMEHITQQAQKWSFILNETRHNST